jgi:hypothetical protein
VETGGQWGWLRADRTVLSKIMDCLHSVKGLSEEPASEGHTEYWDYHHARDGHRLELHVERLEDDDTTIMIKELPQPDDPNCSMTARCGVHDEHVIIECLRRGITHPAVLLAWFPA